jgi:hypothetical protein
VIDVKIRFVILLLSMLTGLPAGAGEWDITGFVAAESRAFWLDGRDADQADNYDISLLLQPEAYWRSDDGRQRVTLAGFAHLDLQDSERTHADLRQAYWGYESEDWDLVLGINKVFWGVAESRHLVDVINQTDLVEDIDQEDKLGQPMINLNLQRNFGRFGFYVLPWFRERTFPGPDGRFRPALPIDGGNPIYESDAKQRHVDLALRYSHYFGDIDFGVHIFDGTSREPYFTVAEERDRLLPVYEQMTQLGVDVRYTREAWLWKFESIVRNAASDTFFASVGGLEYTICGVRDSTADVGVLFEYLFDDRSAAAPPTAFDNDVFLGARLALNDASDTSVLAGIAIDVNTHETFINIEAERRFGDRLSAQLRLRAFGNSEPGEALYPFERDDYVQLRLSWYY